MRSSLAAPSRLTHLAEGVLICLLGFGPLALGSAPAWALAPGCVLALLALGLALLDAQRRGQQLHPPLLAGVLALGVATCAVQLLPLPPRLLALASPRAAEVVDFALQPLGLSSWRPVSLDPPATWRALAAGLAGLAALLASTHLARSRSARRRLLAALVLSGAGISLLGLLHWAAGLERLFGFYRFRYAGPPLLTPFGNPNHLAGFLTLTGTVGLGLALSARERGAQVLWGAASLACAVGVLSSLSRGGILCWVFGQLLLAVLLWRRRGAQAAERGAGIARRVRPWVAVLFLGALCAGGLYASEALLSELATLRTDAELEQGKLALWPMFARAAGEFLRLGMGRGAFEAAFPRFQTLLPWKTFTHPENVVLQLVAEQGLVLGLALVAGTLVCFFRALRRPALETADLAVLAAVAALGLHNLVDFSLELPAVSTAALVALGVVLRQEASAGAGGLALRPSRLLAAQVPLAGVALLAVVLGQSTLASAEDEVLAALHAGRPVAEVRTLAVARIDQHPTHYALYSLVGHALVASPEADPREALAFVNRALFLFPSDAQGHATAARALLRLRQRQQAFLEYRLAYESVPAGGLLDEAVRRARSVDELSLLTPGEVRLAEAVASRLQQAERLGEAVAYLEAMHARFAEADPVGRARLHVAEARLRLRTGAVEAAAAATARAGALAPHVVEVQTARAELLRALHRPEEATALLERLVAQHPGDADVLFALAWHQVALRQHRVAEEVLARAEPLVTGLAQRARLLDIRAQALEQEAYLYKALDARRTAARIAPSAARAFAVARVCERLGRLEEAAAAVREGMAQEPGGGRAESRAWLARLTARAGGE